ncbi:MAG: TIR domain-containing protein [Pyrinomonadaceae bacterium]
MKVFVSWSGEVSHALGRLLKEWLPNVVQAAEPYLSSEDIDKGACWFADVMRELGESDFGIICLTRENVNAPWVLFEAGALSKRIEQSRVVPLLVDLSPAEVKGPLAQFQSATLSEHELYKLVVAVNKCLPGGGLKEQQVEAAFDKWWPDLRRGLETLPRARRHGAGKLKVRRRREVAEQSLRNVLSPSHPTRGPRPDVEVLNPRLRPGPVFRDIQSAIEGRRKPLLALTLDGLSCFSVGRGDTLHLTFDPDSEHLAESVSRPENLQALREASREVLGREMDVRVSVTA